MPLNEGYDELSLRRQGATGGGQLGLCTLRRVQAGCARMTVAGAPGGGRVVAVLRREPGGVGQVVEPDGRQSHLRHTGK